MRLLIFGLVVSGFSAGFALADEPVTAEEWRSLTAGKTLYYFKDGELYGREYYPARDEDDNRVIFRFPTGECAEGSWEKVDDHFCFSFGSQLHCFSHVRRGDEIIVSGDDGDDGDEQSVGAFHEREPLSCAPAVDS